MNYKADCIPLFADTYLCDILDDDGEIVLTLTTEIVSGSVAVYYGDEIARKEIANMDNRGAVLDALERLVESLELPEDLRKFAVAQLDFARTDRRRPAFASDRIAAALI